MKCSVSVLSSPTVETAGSSLVFSFDDKKYFFGNVHEGLQRVCIQNSVRLARLGNLFLTGKTEWKSTGGLMGLILTVADVVQTATQAVKQAMEEAQVKWEEKRAKLQTPKEIEEYDRKQQQPKDKIKIEKPGLVIHGGDNVTQLLATARRFIFRRGLPLKIHEHAHKPSTSAPTWEDHNIQVWALPLRPGQQNEDASTKSPRKRSFTEYSEKNDGQTAGSVDRTLQLQGVVGDMFDSNWRLDTLVETPLTEVQMPAVLFVRNPETKALEPYQGPLPGAGQDVGGVKVLVRKPWPGALVTQLPTTKPSQVSMSYIVRTQPRRGKFDKDLAVKLGVPLGPDFAALTRGESVTTPSGETITSNQVTGPTLPGKGFAVIELPSEEYISSLKDNAAFKDEAVMEGIEAIFWHLGPGITATALFQGLVKEHPNRKHIISSMDHCANYLAMDAAAAAQLRHREIDQRSFGLPLYDNVAVPLPPELSGCIIAQRGISLALAPGLAFSDTMEPGVLNPLDIIERTPKAVKELSIKAHQELKSTAFVRAYQEQQLPDEETEIVTLGTGSAVPSKQRNVSATLLRVPNVGSYLLDCGEGTLGQLSRIYNQDQLQEVLKDLKLIWISHMHADHHLGLMSLINAWHAAVYGAAPMEKEKKDIDQTMNPIKSLTEHQKLCIVSESAMMDWLKEYSEIENFGYDKIVPIRVVPARFGDREEIVAPTRFEWGELTLGFKTVDPKTNIAMRQITGLANMSSVYVSHCTGARAVTMTWPSGLKISYSGDCRPSKRFAAIGIDSTVLIHEATFDDALSGDARAKKHSTTREAIAVGLEMNAKRIILTHFSQRYSKLPELENVVARPIDFEDALHNRSENDGDATGMEPIDGLEGGEQSTGQSSTTPENQTAAINGHGQSNNEQSPNPTPSSNTIRTAQDVKIGVAFDLMRVEIKDIITLEKFKPAFAKLYSEAETSEEKQAGKRAEANAAQEKKEESKRQKLEHRRQKQMAASAAQRTARNATSAERKQSESRPSSSHLPLTDDASGTTQNTHASNPL